MIPGIGYGRNAKVFIDNEINEIGIEISKTSIDLARQNGLNISVPANVIVGGVPAKIIKSIETDQE